MSITHLSPSSLSMFENRRDAFYEHYIMGAPRGASTDAMLLGTAFDYLVKRVIAETWQGVSLGELDISEVTPSVMERAGDALRLYTDSYAWKELSKDLDSADEIRLEYSDKIDILGVPIVGKPDLSYKIGGIQVILDWKVNGWYSKRKVYPASSRLGNPRKKYSTWHGYEILGHKWVDQLTTYAWFAKGYGRECLLKVHQLLPDGVYRHQCINTGEAELACRYKNAWEILHDDKKMSDYFGLSMERVR